MSDPAKLLIGFFSYLIFAPMIGVIASRSTWLQRGLMACLIIIPSLNIEQAGVAAFSFEWYRGHTDGWFFLANDVFAIALILATFFDPRKKDFKFLPPWSWPYLLLYTICCLSIFAAPKPHYTLIALWKFGWVFVHYIAAYNFLRSRRDWHTIIYSAAIAVAIHFGNAVKERYIDGTFQVNSFFDHQNPLAMWVYFIAIPLFAVAVARRTSTLQALVCFIVFGLGFITIVFSLSRMALVIMIAGAAVCIGIGLLSKITLRRVAIVMISLVCAAGVFYKAGDSILLRFTTAGDYDREDDLRHILILMCKKMVRDYPLGVGLNNYNVLNSRPYPRYSIILENWQASHGASIYLDKYENNSNTESCYWMYTAELGWHGLFALIVYLLSRLYMVTRNAWHFRNDYEAPFLWGLSFVLLVLMYHLSLERVTMVQHINMSQYMVFTGIVSRFEYRRRKVQTKPRNLFLLTLFFRWWQKLLGHAPGPNRPRPALADR